MKSSAPWSVKGIKRDARETAKEAARRHGMTVGEWLSQVIYSAGDPESSDGEIEGIKTSDLVTAIEHLNKRVIGAEARGAEAIDDLARNIGVALERLQRLERTRPTEGSPAVEERLQKLEAKTGDRQRIDALRALEKAVGQVALQYDNAHKSTLARLDSTERQLQELASRLDNAEPAASGEPAGLAALKETIAGLSSRLEQAERIASQAAMMKSEAGESVDAEFVERTGARLRILGDEIKRGGDQIRTLEGLIKKLSDQIDAAERRSSEGVQKVAETISQLRSQFGQPEAKDGGEARQEIEAAMAEVTRRTETRISDLQRSFESMIARLEAPGGAAAPEAREEEAAPHSADPSADLEDASGDSTRFAALDAETDIDAIFGDLDDIGTAEGTGDEEAFRFGADELAAAQEDGAASRIIDEVEDNAAQSSAARSDFELDEQDEEEGAAETAISPGPAEDDEADDPLGGLVADRDETSVDARDDYLNQIRRAAREAADSASDIQARRRKLTPKQRALLAAKIRRRRLAEQGLTLSVDAPAASAASDTAPVAAQEVAAEDDGDHHTNSMIARAASALTALRPRRHAEEAAHPDIAAEPERKSDDAPDFTRAAREALARTGIKPVTLALAAAILLAAAALFFVVKDIVSGGAPTPVEAPAATAPGEAVVGDAGSEAASVPAAPSEPLTQPRALYLESLSGLEKATNEAQTREALKSLQQSAALGHPPAQLQLGELYKLGQGVEQDAAQARIWYLRAAEGGNVLAMHRVGVMAARGQGGPADLPAAITWFEKAANFGLVDSQYNLGATYHPASRNGANPAQDVASAYYWYALAARNGDEQARALADGLASSLSPDERRVLDERAAEWTAETPDPTANEVASAS
jgi:localization factor PodJL